MHKIVTGLLLCISMVSAQELLVIPKKQKVSTADLKMDCCQQLKQTLELLPDTLRLVADLQELSMEQLAGMIEDNFNGMSKVEIEKLREQLEKVMLQQQEINRGLQQQKRLLEK